MASGFAVRHLADVPDGRGSSNYSIDFDFDQMIENSTTVSAGWIVENNSP
jgi:hypothetical protein